MGLFVRIKEVDACEALSTETSLHVCSICFIINRNSGAPVSHPHTNAPHTPGKSLSHLTIQYQLTGRSFVSIPPRCQFPAIPTLSIPSNGRSASSWCRGAENLASSPPLHPFLPPLPTFPQSLAAAFLSGQLFHSSSPAPLPDFLRRPPVDQSSNPAKNGETSPSIY